MLAIPQLTQHLLFPDIEQALQEPDGLLAFGGDLTPERLLLAYRTGIFPWYNEGEPILWWSPDPRAVLFPKALHISRSLAKSLRNKNFKVSVNQAFNEVILACAEPRATQSSTQSGTWINSAMINAYQQLHHQGHAHSIEVWQQDKLVGGLYGIHIGQVFFGESMFSRQSDASKIALTYLVNDFHQGTLMMIDCQIGSDHLYRLGARNIPRQQFSQLLINYCQ